MRPVEEAEYAVLYAALAMDAEEMTAGSRS
jgi:hypothetical protein